MSEEVISASIVLTCGLFQYCSLILAGKQKDVVWKRGIYAGMTASGLAAFSFNKPSLIPGGWYIFSIGTAIMLGCVLYSYLETYPVNTQESIERKQGAIRELIIGLVFIVLLSIVTSVVQSRSGDQKLVKHLDPKLDSLMNAVSELTISMTQLTANVSGIASTVNSNVGRLSRLEQRQVVKYKRDSLYQSQQTLRTTKLLKAQTLSIQEDKKAVIESNRNKEKVANKEIKDNSSKDNKEKEPIWKIWKHLPFIKY